MSASIDANVLVYADNLDDPAHGQARALIDRLSTGRHLLYLFWPTIFAYLRISTNPRLLRHPIAPSAAIHNIDALLLLPQVISPGEREGSWRTYLDSGGSAVAGRPCPTRI